MQPRYDIRGALLEARHRLTALDPESASLNAHILLSAALGVDRAWLLAHGTEMIPPAREHIFFQMVARAERGEPIPYILGQWGFYDREFIVSPAVLIPRPETELLLDQALAFAQPRDYAVVVDVGTGSGALAVTLAALCPKAVVYAIDASPAALEIARRNADVQAADVIFFEGDLLTPIFERQMQVDLVMANLPYIPSHLLPHLAVSRHEPRQALDGGADGLALVRRLLDQAPPLCRPGARLLLEIAYDQGAVALALARTAFPTASIDVLKDYAGHDRVVRIDLAAK
jgi:release factor glutamine methyltransferase